MELEAGLSRGGTVTNPAEDLPSYTQSRNTSLTTAITNAGPQTEHQRFLTDDKKRTSISIVIKSRSPRPEGVPVFFEGDEIAGRVEIDLDKGAACKGVSVIIKGGSTFVGQDEQVFLHEERVLWASSGDSTKFSGKQVWPFTFTLPREVQVKDGSGGKVGTFRLPPSFTERASAAYIDYKVILVVKRGFLRVNRTLETTVAFYPTTIPKLPTPLRRMAYAEGTPLLGPDADPEGWASLPAVTVKGSLFQTKDVDAECHLCIGAPLTYAVNSPIPLLLTVASPDAQLLDLLTKPATKAVRVCLLRSLATGAGATSDDASRRSDNHFVEEFGEAYFWPSPQAEQISNKRVLQGELEVPRGLKPSFKFPGFTVRYSLNLVAQNVPGFATPSDGMTLVSESIEVVTRQLLGIKPTSYAPPGYEKPGPVDYNKSIGLLENGNQRFLGHIR